MAEYSRIAKGSFTASGTSKIIPLPFQPDYVELWNYSNIKTAAINSVTRAWWDNKLADGSNNPTMVQLYAASATSSVFDTVATNGISPISFGNIQLGVSKQIIGITKASAARINVTAHGYSVGDQVVLSGLYQSSTTGMPQIAGVFFNVITVSDADHFDIQWNTNQSNYTALSGSPVGSVVNKVLNPFNYVPGANIISAITTGVTTTVVTAMNHNFEVGQEVAFRIPTSWGTTQLNSLPNDLIPGSPLYGYVTSITDNLTFVCNINSIGYTAFNSNQLVGGFYTSTAGAQIVPVGDVNTGGSVSGLSASTLYPSPQFPTSTNRVSTINGPAIRGAFVNNTMQGFLIGSGAANVDTSATIMASGNIILWHAYLHDYASP